MGGSESWEGGVGVGSPASGKGRLSSGMWTRLREREGEGVLEESDSVGKIESCYHTWFTV